MYIPEFFKAHELVPPEIYKKRGDKSFELIDERLLRTLDALRKDLGPMTINNWFWGGAYKDSGLRTPSSEYFSPTSQHTFGRAADIKFKNYTPAQVIKLLKKNHDKYPFLTFLETGTKTWVHIDVRNCKKLTTWSPT